MSRERARAREARLAARQAEIAAAAVEREKQVRRQARRARLRVTLPPVPLALLRTVIVVGGVELIATLLDVSLRVRLGLAVVILAVLFVYAASSKNVSRRSPTR